MRLPAKHHRPLALSAIASIVALLIAAAGPASAQTATKSAAASATKSSLAPAAAFKANTGILWIYNPNVGNTNTRLGVRSNTSPAIAVSANAHNEDDVTDNP